MTDAALPSTQVHSRGDYDEKWKHIQNIKHLIHAAEHYCVFIDTDNDVDWETSREYDIAGHKSLSKHNAILNQAALLESTPCNGLADDVRFHFKRLIGEGVARSFDQDYQSATNMLSAAKGYILARGEEMSRRWYLSASFVATVPFALVGSLVWFCRSCFIKALGTTVLWITLTGALGALGALLSVIARTGKLKFDCSSGSWLHYLEGGSRICAGALSGMVVGLSIISGTFLASLTHGGNMHSIMLVAAFAAGAVERLATSIISTVGAENARLGKAAEGHHGNTADG